jgi:hypothetical protein
VQACSIVIVVSPFGGAYRTAHATASSQTPVFDQHRAIPRFHRLATYNNNDARAGSALPLIAIASEKKGSLYTHQRDCSKQSKYSAASLVLIPRTRHYTVIGKGWSSQ